MNDRPLVADSAGIVVQPRAFPALAVVGRTGYRLDQLVLSWIGTFTESPATRDAYGRDVRQYLEWCESRGVDPLSIDLPTASMYATALADTRNRNGEPLARRTRLRKLAAVTNFYGYLKVAQAIDNSPWPDVSRPKKPRRSPTVPPSPPQVLDMYGAASQVGADGLLGAECAELVMAFLVVMGMRAAEVCGLERARLARDGSRIRVREKGGEERWRPVPVQMRPLLVAWLAVRPRPADRQHDRFLLLNRHGRPLDRRRVWEFVKAVAAAVGVDLGDHPHALRHAFNDLALLGGHDLDSRRASLGHVSGETTRLYTHEKGAPEDDPVHTVARMVLEPRQEETDG